MAEGRAARWTAAALAAPVVAGVFAATTSWATKADPLHPKGTGEAAGQPTPQALATPDPAIVALQAQLAREQATVDRLSAKVAAVRAKAAALAKGSSGGSGGSGGSAGSGRSSGGSSSSARTSSSHSSTSRSSSSGSTSHSTPAPAPAPPPTSGSTGASGTK